MNEIPPIDEFGLQRGYWIQPRPPLFGRILWLFINHSSDRHGFTEGDLLRVLRDGRTAFETVAEWSDRVKRVAYLLHYDGSEEHIVYTESLRAAVATVYHGCPGICGGTEAARAIIGYDRKGR